MSNLACPTGDNTMTGLAGGEAIVMHPIGNGLALFLKPAPQFTLGDQGNGCAGSCNAVEEEVVGHGWVLTVVRL
jgi:hypothetical protein